MNSLGRGCCSYIHRTIWSRLSAVNALGCFSSCTSKGAIPFNDTSTCNTFAVCQRQWVNSTRLHVQHLTQLRNDCVGSRRRCQNAAYLCTRVLQPSQSQGWNASGGQSVTGAYAQQQHHQACQCTKPQAMLGEPYRDLLTALQDSEEWI